MKWHWYGAPLDELREFAMLNSAGNAVATNVLKVPESFRAYAHSWIVDMLGYKVDHWNYWVATLGGGVRSGYGVRKHDDNPQSPDWERKFPHCHGWDGRTVVLQLAPPESGGEFVYFDDDHWTERESIVPVAGDCTLISDHEWHGVRRIEGDKPRTTMMAGAYPYPRGEVYCQCGNTPVKARKVCPW